MKILKLLGLTSILALTTIPFVGNKKSNFVFCDTVYVGLDNLQKQIDEIKKELEELKHQGKEHCKKFNDLKETLIKLQEQLKYNQQKDKEQSKKIEKIEDKINNSTIATCSTVGGGVVLATVPTLLKNKKDKKKQC